MTERGHRNIQIVGGVLAVAFLSWLVLFGLKPDRNLQLNDLLRGGAMKGDAATANALLGRGADVDARDSMGMTPLMWAILKGNKETMTVLMNAGCDFDADNNNGLTALDLADQNHKTGRAQFLRDAIAKRASRKPPSTASR